MNKQQLEQLVMQVINEKKPGFESSNQSYFYGLVKLMQEKMNAYDSAAFGEEEYAKKIIGHELDEVLKTFG